VLHRHWHWREGGESHRTLGFEISVEKVKGKKSDEYGNERREEREENLRREENGWIWPHLFEWRRGYPSRRWEHKTVSLI